MTPERMLVVRCADWPVVATGRSSDVPVVVMQANRVVSASVAARREGVTVGLRRREAQARCPEVEVIDAEPSRDARAFEPIVATVEALAPRVEVMAPGCCAVPTRGPSRYFGGDDALMRHLALLVDETLRDNGLDVTCSIGIADGVFAATLAAGAGMVVPPNASRSFLAPQPITVLEHELVDVLRRLGIRTLGDFAALPASDVLGRFGYEGAVAHRHAQGLDDEPFIARIPPAELSVAAELDPPVQRVDTAAFTAKNLADRLCDGLASHGLSCSRLVIEAETEHGDVRQRVWRHDGRLSAGAVAERVRWQLDGWLTGVDAEYANAAQSEHDDGIESTGGLISLRLVPEGLMADNGTQLGFWGGTVDVDERTARALARVQGMLGEEGVVTGVLGGGRNPLDQVRLVPWGQARVHAQPGAPDGVSTTDVVTRARRRRPEVPAWPGQLPVPAPATVYPIALDAVVVDEDDVIVAVDARGTLSNAPTRCAIAGGPFVAVVAWAGPWIVDERWWDATARCRRARLQLLTADGAVLASLQQHRWTIEARYD